MLFAIYDNFIEEWLSYYSSEDSETWQWSHEAPSPERAHDYENMFIPHEGVHIFECLNSAKEAKKHLEEVFLADGDEVDFKIFEMDTTVGYVVMGEPDE